MDGWIDGFVGGKVVEAVVVECYAVAATEAAAAATGKEVVKRWRVDFN